MLQITEMLELIYSTSLWRRLSSLVEEGSFQLHTKTREEGSSSSTSLGCAPSGCSSPVTPTCCLGCPEGLQRWHLVSSLQMLQEEPQTFFFFLFKSRKKLTVCFIRSDDWDEIFNPQAFTSAWIFNLISYLTSKPRSAVGLCRGRMNTEALAGQHVTVFGFLHQEANLCQQAVQEAGQHGGASDHHQVLREHFTGVDGALKQMQTDILNKTLVENICSSLFDCCYRQKEAGGGSHPSITEGFW